MLKFSLDIQESVGSFLSIRDQTNMSLLSKDWNEIIYNQQKRSKHYQILAQYRETTQRYRVLNIYLSSCQKLDGQVRELEGELKFSKNSLVTKVVLHLKNYDYCFRVIKIVAQFFPSLKNYIAQLDELETLNLRKQELQEKVNSSYRIESLEKKLTDLRIKIIRKINYEILDEFMMCGLFQGAHINFSHLPRVNNNFFDLSQEEMNQSIMRNGKMNEEKIKFIAIKVKNINTNIQIALRFIKFFGGDWQGFGNEKKVLGGHLRCEAYFSKSIGELSITRHEFNRLKYLIVNRRLDDWVLCD